MMKSMGRRKAPEPKLLGLRLGVAPGNATKTVQLRPSAPGGAVHIRGPVSGCPWSCAGPVQVHTAVLASPAAHF